MFNIVGRTVGEDGGKTVLAGVYRFYETEGLPLDTLFEILQGKNAIPCWVSLYKEAGAAGMKHERILSRLETAISDIYGASFKDRVIARLRKLHEVGLI
jgi:hypothetical protein